jgi:hypothetical protein
VKKNSINKNDDYDDAKDLEWREIINKPIIPKTPKKNNRKEEEELQES